MKYLLVQHRDPAIHFQQQVIVREINVSYFAEDNLEMNIVNFSEKYVCWSARSIRSFSTR